MMHARRITYVLTIHKIRIDINEKEEIYVKIN